MNRRKFDNPSEIVKMWKDGISLETLANRFHTCYGVLHKLLISQLSPKEFSAIKHSHLRKGGKATRFHRGQLAWNKGIPFDSGGRSHETRFKPGQIRGSAARKYRDVGFISIRHYKSKCNAESRGRRKISPYRYIKIKDSGPPQHCWIQYARYIYEKTYGPIPQGFFPIHKDGDTLNDDPTNLVLVNRADNLRRNGHSPEVRLYAHARAVKHRKQNTLIRKLHTASQPQLPDGFECPECGWYSNARQPPDRCPKCGCNSIVSCKQKVA